MEKSKNKPSFFLESLKFNSKDNMINIKINDKGESTLYSLALEEVPKAIQALENDEI